MGFSGTFIAKSMIARAGLLRTGVLSTVFQGMVLGGAALIYHVKLSAVHVSQQPLFALAECTRVLLYPILTLHVFLQVLQDCQEHQNSCLSLIMCSQEDHSLERA